MRKRKIRFISLFFILGIIILIFMIKKYMPNFRVVSVQEVFNNFGGEKTGLILGKDIIVMENEPKIIDEEIFLPFDFVKEYVDPYIFWDEEVEKLTITTKNKVIRMKTDELTYYVNQQPLTLQLPLRKFGDVPYISFSFLKDLFNIEANYNEENNIVIMDYTTDVKKIGEIITKKAPIRYEGNIKSPILKKLILEDKVRIFEENEDWYYVRTEDGIIGYIAKKHIGNIETIQGEELEVEDISPSWKPVEGKINLVWDQVFKPEDSEASYKFNEIKGLDVLSPSWFSIENENGDLKNIASKKYVDWAHSKGYQVWAMITNPFTDSDLTHKVLSNTDKRENIIKQLLAFASLYDLDGINIDFESLRTETGEYYVQFIRELTPLLKEQGLVVSVDMYVPSGWTRHYNRAEVGKVVDYIIVMAYDEHWSTSPESGSVASIGWVEEGIKNTLEEVPKEKVILGLPYYTRLWKEEIIDGEIQVSSRAYGMARGENILKENNVEPVWLEDIGQYYGEYKEGDITYKIWLEEERSIEEKVKLVDKYDLAGVAGWKRGLEKEEIWDVLYEYLKN
ncbi:glycosyl hydrolase family 18 protein [Defluviitalea phaphyphila]|uniref:glycosyl hydrolase family 18 protein n=1 Tax=Defluviitalea phaphyphila TaxID=1473580 RepID=UPI00072FA980|nr:glycosyl hydrolase family 18 protein [Defluviitalea phaphyphila]